MRIRVEARSMTDAGLAAFRQAIRASMDIADDRGYAKWAGVHGLPLPVSCKHRDPLFLPWHRAYLYLFEKSLQDRVPEVTLPWWDWTSIESRAEGIPRSYTEAAGNNPLRRARVVIDPADIALLRQTPGLISSGANPTTVRDPDIPANLPKDATIASILNAGSFLDFSSRLENVHGDVHGWVGGSMSRVPIAAFDPIFWAHHAMIDRLWYVWQLRHPNAPPPAVLLNRALDPFPFTVAQMLEISQLGYDYAIAAVQ